MLKLSNISYERESGKFNFKVFLTVDVSISEVHLRHLRPRDNINAPQWRERELAGEICMKKSVWNWMWGRMYFTCNLYYILLIYALLLCFIVSEVVKCMAWLGYLQQKCLWIKFMEGSRRQSCSSLQVEIASGGIFFKRSLLCNQKSHTAQTHLKMITRARAINLKHM